MNMIECHVKEKVIVFILTDEILTKANVALGECAKIDWLFNDRFVVQKWKGNAMLTGPSRCSHVIRVRNSKILIKAPTGWQELFPLTKMPLAYSCCTVPQGFEKLRDDGFICWQTSYSIIAEHTTSWTTTSTS
jgi:hypothetical protein